MASKSDGATAALAARLAEAGKPAEILRAPDGARVVVLPHGARVLGVFPGTEEEGFLWNNSALDRTDSARRLFESGAWCNTGGDRTWIAPEADFFLPRYPREEGYFQPRVFDPGSFTCRREATRLVMSTSFSLHSFRTAEDVGLSLSKSVEAMDPDAVRNDLPVQGILSCGYTLRCTLEVTQLAPRTPVGLWNLLQLPHGGVMLFGVKDRPEPVLFFGLIPAEDVGRQQALVQWAMRGQGDKKIGLPPESVTGRVGYLHGNGGRADLIVRDFAVDPGLLYIDTPRSGPPACAVQACAVNNAALGSFSELEYHAPAIGGDTGRNRYDDVSTVRFFRGPRTPIEHLAARMMGASPSLTRKRGDRTP